MKTLVTSTNWEGMPCTLRYDSGKPVAVGDVVGQLVVKGGSAPHHCGSTGYVYTNEGQRYASVINARWTEDFEPRSYVTEYRQGFRKTPRSRNYTFDDNWEFYWSANIDPTGEHGYSKSDACMICHGYARRQEQNLGEQFQWRVIPSPDHY